jgi:hypothetical protein
MLEPGELNESSPLLSGAAVDADHQRRRLLSAFLTEHRHRLAPGQQVLGEHVRRAESVGRVVARREIADASGINRRWYELAESSAPTRASAAILRSLGNVLRLNAEERRVLVSLATPYLDRETPRDESLEIRDAFGSMRWYLRKLNACSSIEEVLRLVEDTAASHFAEIPYLTTASRLPDGAWTFHGEGTGTASRLAVFTQEREEVVGPIFAAGENAADELMCFPEASSPGELLTFDDYDTGMLTGILKDGYRRFERLHESMLAAVIRSRTGFAAHLYLADFRRTYDAQTDRAFVMAIADFASLVVVP